MNKYRQFTASMIILGLTVSVWSEMTIAKSAGAEAAKDLAEASGDSAKSAGAGKAKTEPTAEDISDIPVPLTAAEKQEICKEFSRKNISYISYYENVFEIKNCERIRLSNSRVKELTRRGVRVQDADHKAIEALPLRPKIIEKGAENREELCKKYHHKYITYAYVDVYWVEGCVKHPFPDWSSYENHAGKLRDSRPSLVTPASDDFYRLETGEPMKSIIDEEFRSMLQAQGDQADLLPLDEACKGINGQYVTYLGQIYFIDRKPGKKGTGPFCHRRVVDSEEFTRKRGMSGFNLPELSSSQALSIPVGEPMIAPKKS